MDYLSVFLALAVVAFWVVALWSGWVVLPRFKRPKYRIAMSGLGSDLLARFKRPKYTGRIVWKVGFVMTPVVTHTSNVKTPSVEVSAYGIRCHEDEPVQFSPFIPGYHQLLARTEAKDAQEAVSAMTTIMEDWVTANGVDPDEVFYR